MWLSDHQNNRMKAALLFAATAAPACVVTVWARGYDWTRAVDEGGATIYTYSPWAVVGVLALGFAYCLSNYVAFKVFLKDRRLANTLGVAFLPFILICAHGMHGDFVEVGPQGFSAGANWGFSTQSFTDRFIRFDELTRIRMTTKQLLVGQRGRRYWESFYYLCLETKEGASLELEIDGPVKRRAVSRILELAEGHGIPVSRPYKKNTGGWVVAGDA